MSDDWRLLPKREREDGDVDPFFVEWLATLENERRAMLMRLRYIEQVLARHGRLGKPLPKRED